jgi:hypothetical protein
MMRMQGRRPRRSMADLVGQMNSASYARRNAEIIRDRLVGKELW